MSAPNINIVTTPINYHITSPTATFALQVSNIQENIKAAVPLKKEEAFANLQMAYDELSLLKPVSPAEIHTARVLEAQILGTYGKIIYPSFERAVTLSTAAVKKLTHEDIAKFEPLYKVALDKVEFSHDHELVTTHPETILKFAATLEDDQKILMAKSFFTLCAAYHHLGAEKFNLSQNQFSEVCKNFNFYSIQILKLVKNPTEEVRTELGESQYNHVSGEYLNRVEKGKGDDATITKEEFIEYKNVLNKANDYNQKPEMKARIANLTFCNFDGYFLQDKNKSNWSTQDLEEARSYIVDSVTRWEALFKEIDSYSDADQQRYQDLRSNVYGNYLYFLDKLGEKDPERTMKHIDYCKAFVQKYSDPNIAKHPYRLIHMISLVKTYRRLGQIEEAKKWLAEFDKAAQAEKSWISTGKYVEAANALRKLLEEQPKTT